MSYSIQELVSQINKIGQEYLQKYPTPGFYLSNFNRHGHQTQASKLQNYMPETADSYYEIYRWLYNEVVDTLKDSNGDLGMALRELCRVHLPTYQAGFNQALIPYENSSCFPTNKEVIAWSIKLFLSPDKHQYAVNQESMDGNSDGIELRELNLARPMIQ